MKWKTIGITIVAASYGIAVVYAQTKEPENGPELAKLLYEKYHVVCVTDRDGNIYAASFSEGEIKDMGDALDRIAQIPTVLVVDMTGRRLTKNIISKFRDFPKLAVLDLAYCKFEDEDLKALESSSLAELDLAGTPITDKGLAHLKSLKTLQRLDLSQSKVDGSGFKSLEVMPIEDLNLTMTQITDESLKSIGRIHSLRDLDLSHTSITDDGLLHLSGLYLLRKLNLDEAQTTHAGRRWFREEYDECRSKARQQGFLPRNHPDLVIVFQ